MLPLRDYEQRERINKHGIQNYFIEQVGEYYDNGKINVMCLFGSEYKSLVDKYFNTVMINNQQFGTIISVENNPNTMKCTIKNSNNCDYMHNGQIRLIKGYIEDTDESTAFMDMDLMCGWEYGLPIFIKKLNDQMNNENLKDQVKYFLFTVSLRRNHSDHVDVINKLLKPLHAKVLSVDRSSIKIDEFETHTESRHFAYRRDIVWKTESDSIANFELFSYGDGAPMITGMITYIDPFGYGVSINK